MVAIATVLDIAVRAICPAIDGVSVGDPNDKTTWIIFYQLAATDAQKAAVVALVNSFVFDPEVARKQMRDIAALNDLGLVADFNNKVAVTPGLTFSSYLDSLEAAATTLSATPVSVGAPVLT